MYIVFLINFNNTKLSMIFFPLSLGQIIQILMELFFVADSVMRRLEWGEAEERGVGSGGGQAMRGLGNREWQLSYHRPRANSITSATFK
jgi:hypothetical protein